MRAAAKIGCTKGNCGGYHPYWAIDFLDPGRTMGDPVYAAGSGSVIGRGTYGSCLGDSGAAITSPNARGNWVEVDHGNGIKTRYFHLQSIAVRQGQAVTNRTLLGKVGNTGASTCSAPHLHFEKIEGGRKVNPGILYACHGNKRVGYSNWIGDKGSLVHSDGVNCGSSNNPRGHLDKVSSPSAGRVRVAGWAFDPDAKTSSVGIHVYIGGKVGASGATGYNIGKASRKRPDIAEKFPGAGSRHGFDETLRSSRNFGRQLVCVYAINIGRGSNELLGCKVVTIRKPPQDAPPAVTPPLADEDIDRLEGRGDFNGDGRDDVAALYAYPDNTAFNVFAGTPTGLASTWERRWTSSTNGWDWSRTK